ncbi:hypothetical protein [Micromonospora sp. NPDC005189]|uniref:ImmA/IrrE family metallo-endopeptidase n=1 Tax=Micromonospora sp. NPDC005189 TaxID=3157019 RepID=UPI0033BA464A
MSSPAEPGSQLLERQATAFASRFLTPAARLREELPGRLDFGQLHGLKRRWGIVYVSNGAGLLSNRLVDYWPTDKLALAERPDAAHFYSAIDRNEGHRHFFWITR